MTDKITMMTDYHLGRVNQIIINSKQVASGMVEDSKLGHNYAAIASTVNEACKLLEKAKQQLEGKAKERKRYLERG